MANYFDLKKSLDYIREGYSKGKSPFRFTVSDIAKAADVSEKKAKNIIKTMNNYAQFWRGNYVTSGDNYIVSSQAFERIKNWFK